MGLLQWLRPKGRRSAGLAAGWIGFADSLYNPQAKIVVEQQIYEQDRRDEEEGGQDSDPEV